jgi:hypothetical protein
MFYSELDYYQRVWEFVTWGLTLGFGLALTWHLIGFYVGAALRWTKELVT